MNGNKKLIFLALPILTAVLSSVPGAQVSSPGDVRPLRARVFEDLVCSAGRGVSPLR